jgi:hypothetical protein
VMRDLLDAALRSALVLCSESGDQGSGWGTRCPSILLDLTLAVLC